MSQGPVRAPETIIRPARVADAPAIAEQHLTTREWAYKGLVPDEHMRQSRSRIGQRAELYAERIRTSDSKSRTWVADRQGEIVGFAMTGPSRDEGEEPEVGELEAIYVHPDVIGQGVGRALWDQALHELRDQGYREVMLWVFEENDLARRFYEAAGFRLDGARRIQDWAGKELAAVRFRRTI